jgi:DNA-binding transcriptional ArsR family regulator
VLAILSEVEKRQKMQLRWAISEARMEEIIREECHKGQVTVRELESGVKWRTVSAVREAIALRNARELGLSAA